MGSQLTVVAAVLVLVLACQDDSVQPQNNDLTPPATVTDLSASEVSESEILLTWTAPGDDGRTGRAKRYLIRYAATPLTDSLWGQADSISNVPAPGWAGKRELTTISGLPDGTWDFALKTVDENSNWSPLSNPATARSGDHTPPARVTDLSGRVIDDGAVLLTWKAPGDDGNVGRASIYDLRRDTTEITPETWARATPVPDVPPPRTASQVEEVVVYGLDSGRSYSFALRAADEGDRWSELSNVLSIVVRDVTPPGGITDLAICSSEPGAVSLRWSATGNDGLLGTAAAYDLRYARAPLTAASWIGAIQVVCPLAPAAAGSEEQFAVRDLPAGQYLYWAIKAGDRGGNWSPLSNVASVTVSSTPLHQITSNSASLRGAYEPAWSPDGAAVVLAADWDSPVTQPNMDIYVVDLPCGKPTRLTADPESDIGPTWAPSGTEIAFVSFRGGLRAIWKMEAVEGATPTRLTDNQSGAANCAWSPDGLWIAYDAALDEQLSEIRMVPSIGGAPIALVTAQGSHLSPTWSPNGSKIAFYSNRSGNWDIWVVTPGHGEPVQITSDPADDIEPSWSPDGGRIAFSSTRSGNPEIWMMSATGADPVQVTDDPAVDFKPSWSPLGDAIAFCSNRTGKMQVWSVNVE